MYSWYKFQVCGRPPFANLVTYGFQHGFHLIVYWGTCSDKGMPGTILSCNVVEYYNAYMLEKEIPDQLVDSVSVRI